MEDVVVIYRIGLVDSDIVNGNILRERTAISLATIQCEQHQIDHRHLVKKYLFSLNLIVRGVC